MANNEQQSQQPQTQTPGEIEKPEFSLEQFEPDVFWKEHGRKITWGVAIALVLGLVAYLYQLQTAQKAEGAAIRLAEAQTTGDYEKIIKDNLGVETTAQAMLRLGDLQFRDGKYKESAATYQQLLTSYPQHALVDAARLGLAAVLEAQGKYEESRQQYGTLASKPRTFTAIAARIGGARCAEMLGQIKEARQLYEELLPVVQGTAWQNIVYLRWTVLGRNLPKEAPAPATTLPPNIAPLQTSPITR